MRRDKLQLLNIDGVLILDKAGGLSSNKALQEVKRLFQAKKAGHTGSLDPLATGVLPICFGKATKLANKMLADDKVYQVTIQMGEKTDTGDCDGEVIAHKPVPELNNKIINETLETFIGESLQVPPMYSALKHNGVRLYELARKGIEVEREPRPIHIFKFDLISKLPNNQLELSVHCSKGTYIRTLIEDFAEKLDCYAHVIILRRLAAGHFKEANAIRYEELVKIKNNDGDWHLHQLLKPVDEVDQLG